LDRDGIINEDNKYVFEFEKIKWRRGIFETISFLKSKKFLICVVSNQSGIARGFFKEKDVKFLHIQMNKIFKIKTGFVINKFKYCPYHPKAKILKYRKNSLKRKPAPGMILEYIKEKKLNKKNCILFGDKKIDLKAALNANIKGYQIKKNIKNIYPFIKKIIYQNFDV